MKEFEQLLDGSLPKACGAAEVFRLRAMEVGADVLPRVPAYLGTRQYTSAFLVADQRTWDAAGARVASLIGDGGQSVTRHLLSDPDGGHDPCANDETVESCREALASSGCDVIVSVGSGTVNDVAKMAATQEDIPFVTVPTAASMNGYTSAIAAILSKGVKRTIPTHQAEAVFADVGVVAVAPERLNLAGFGDLASKPYSNACWYLSHKITGGARSDAPAQLLDGPFHRLLESAPGLRTAEPDAVEVLIQTLLLSGCAMALAGSSSPASGGEHLISHYWDMVEHASHRPVRALHGTQVGVATCLSAQLYERIVAMEVGEMDVDARMAAAGMTVEERRAQVQSRHPALPQQIVDEIVAEAVKKALSPQAQRERLMEIRSHWNEWREELRGLLLPSDTIRAALSAAGAPTRASELGVNDRTLSHTVKVCRDMRSRYTVLDLASDWGLLEPFSIQCTQEG